MTGNNMNRAIVLSLLVFFFATHIQAKTTYIPTYDNRLLLIENGEMDSLTNKALSLVISSKDGLITCTLAQQVVSEELVRDIKRAKNAAGWAMVEAELIYERVDNEKPFVGMTNFKGNYVTSTRL